MSGLWGEFTDDEFNEVKGRIGDMALEAPDLVKRLVEDMRREKALSKKEEAAR